MEGYYKSVTAHGGTSKVVNFEKFAHDLAAELGAEFHSDPMPDRSKWHYVIKNGVRLSFHVGVGAEYRGKIEVNAWPADAKESEIPSGWRKPHIKVSLTADIKQIARDVERRLLATCGKALDELRQHQAECKRIRDDAATWGDRIHRATDLHVDTRHHEGLATFHQYRGSLDGVGFRGRIDHNGIIALDRVEGLTYDQFVKFFKIIKGGE